MRHRAVWPPGLPETLPPPEGSVYDNIRRAVERAPDRDALVYYGRRTRYADLSAHVERLAAHLSGAGVRAGDRVALYMQNAPQFVVAYYAILAANAVIVPINPMCLRDELAYVLRDAGAVALLYGTERAPEVSAIWEDAGRPHLVHAHYRHEIDPDTDLDLPRELIAPEALAPGVPWRDALSDPRGVPHHDRGPEDWCIIPYSSGTTGQPKGCLHTHASVNAVIQAYPLWIGVAEGARVLATLPFCHVTGMQHSMNLPIRMAATTTLMTRWNAGVAADLIEREKIEHWRSITTMMIDFLALPGIAARDLSSLKAVGGGGAQMPQDVARKMADLIGLPYIEAYGLTETMAPILINPPQAPRPQCLGIPIFDVDARIVHPDTLEELAPGFAGEIVVQAPQVFAGYWQRPEETAAAFLEIAGKRFFRTGDIGQMDEDGFFTFVDRLKRMINVGGLKVWPAEVEAILHGHPEIAEACVVADPDPRTGEAVRAVLVPRPGPTPAGLTAWCRARMARYKVPQRFEFREALPRSGAGKVLWREL